MLFCIIVFILLHDIKKNCMLGFLCNSEGLAHYNVDASSVSYKIVIVLQIFSSGFDGLSSINLFHSFRTIRRI